MFLFKLWALLKILDWIIGALLFLGFSVFVILVNKNR